MVIDKEIEDDPISPFYYEPLAVVVPSGNTELAKGPISKPSQRVKRRHRGFCKLVGFPIESHEQECLALLQHIEENCFAKKATVGTCRQPASGIKGTRELHSLISYVNYEGR